MGKPAKRRSSRAAPAKKLVIRNANGTYFWKWTVIGPCFGATLQQAKRFDSREDAADTQCRHAIAFVGTEVEEVDDG